MYHPRSPEIMQSPIDEPIPAYLSRAGDMYHAAVGAIFNGIVAQTKALEGPAATAQWDAAHMTLFMATADLADTGVSDAAFHALRRPSSKWQAVLEISKGTGHFPERYTTDLAEASMEARRDSEEADRIREVKIALATHATKLALAVVEDSATEAARLERYGEDEDTNLRTVVAQLSRNVSPELPVMTGGEVDITDLEILLKAGRYQEAAVHFEAMVCLGADDHLLHLRAAGLMVRYRVADKTKDESLMSAVTANIKALSLSEITSGHDVAQSNWDRLTLRDLAIETVAMATEITDVPVRARALLACRLEAEQLGLADGLLLQDGRRLEDVLQAAWTSWARIIPHDPERAKWAEIASQHGVDMDVRHPSAWLKTEVV